MTYMPDSNFSSAVDQDLSTAEKVKTLTQEGAERSQRVAKIFRTAFSEVAAEVKEGRVVLSPLAKEVTVETVATVKDKSQQAADVVSHTWQQESDKKDITDRVVAFMRSLAGTLKVKLFPQLKDQAVKLDSVLSDRYGQRYNNIKGPFEVVRSWNVVSETFATENATENATEKPSTDVASDSSVVIEVDSKEVS